MPVPVPVGGFHDDGRVSHYSVDEGDASTPRHLHKRLFGGHPIFDLLWGGWPPHNAISYGMATHPNVRTLGHPISKSWPPHM